jgi:hypothetical protein
MCSPLENTSEDIKAKYAVTFTITKNGPALAASPLSMQALAHTARNFVLHPHPRLGDFFFRLLTEAAQSYLIILICPFTYLLIKKR